MMQTTPIRRLHFDVRSWLLLTLATVLPCPAAHADWIVDVNLATATAAGTNFAHMPAINDLGDVAFVGNLLTSPTTEGVYRVHGNVITPIKTGGLYQGVSSASINDAGAVAYTVNPTFFSGFGIYRGDATGTTTIASRPGPYGNDAASNFPSIANNGAVAFILNNDGITGGTRGTGVFVGLGGGALRTVASTTAFIDLDVIRQPISSNNGIIAYEWRGADGSTPILITDNSGIQTNITSLGKGVSGFTDFAVNDNGLVAFVGMYASGDFGLFEGNGGQVTKLVTNLDAFNTIQSVALNNSGQLAILAKPGTASYSGIYLGLDPLHDKVVAVGDSLLGSTIKTLGFGHHGLNDAGQLAFYARLADNREGIFVATMTDQTPPFPGDANGDHVVNFDDLNILLTNYGLSGTFSTGDFDHSGAVDFTDLNMLLTNYGLHAPLVAAIAPIPEPGTFALAALGALGLLIGARRKLSY